MKDYLFFGLFSVLIIPQSFSQKTLSPSVRPYAENWTYSLVKSMHRAGFDMPAMAAAPVLTNGVSSRSALQLDSTKTFYGYGLNAPGDSTPLFRSTYQYPQPDVKIEVNYQYDNGAWLALNRSTLVSDGQQRLVEVTAEAFDPVAQQFNPDSKLVLFPHGDSPVLIDSFFTYLWDTTILDWHLILASRNVFDAQDRQLENITSLDYFGDPLIFKEVYAYDANGDNYLIEEFGILGDEVSPTGRTDIVYADHRPIEVTVSASDGFGFFPENRTNYAYTLFGAVRKQMNFEWDAEKEDFRLYQTIDYTYDFAQRLAAKETAFMPLNAWEERERIDYAYVDDENVYLEWVHLWDEDKFDWILDSKKFYYYDGLVAVRPTPNHALPLAVWPNPTTGLVQFAFEQEASVQVFDATGQLVQSRLIQAGQQTLDLTPLPAGVYTVTARHDNDFYSGRIVKQY